MMAHLLTGDDKFHEESSGDYRFARTHVKRGNRMRSALRRVNGYLKTMIEAIARLEGAPDAARSRASRHSFRSARQQLGGA
jgi:hypothetical protein